MNLQNQLSIKSALRFALPCLASALLFSACSNEVSDITPENLPSGTIGTVRFSASAPFASEDVATRIGIDNDKKPSVDEWTKDEPIVWLGDEEVSVFFVSKANGAEIHAKFKIDGNGKSADLVNVTELSQLNGDYEIYAFTPYVAGNTLSQAQLSLASQSQDANTSTYSHLSKSAYMRASGVEATFAIGSLKSGDVNFHFEHITSFLRFNISNSLGGDLVITGISLTHPNMSSNASYDIKLNALVPTDTHSTISLSFGDGGQNLPYHSSFDAYMSSFTLWTSAEPLQLAISLGGIFTPLIYNIPMSDLATEPSSTCFRAGTRFLIDIDINSSSPLGIILPAYESTVYRGFEYNIFTKSGPYDNISTIYGKFTLNDTAADYCPDGWSPLLYEDIRDMGLSVRLDLAKALGPNYLGYRLQGPANTVYREHYLVVRESMESTRFWYQGPYAMESLDQTVYLRPICRRLAVN